jgi:AP-1 complex subunit beta-1
MCTLSVVHITTPILTLIKAVVLAHRPPISLTRTTVSPALLEELLGEISTLSSIYHKPAETFVGRGRVGADAVAKKGAG